MQNLFTRFIEDESGATAIEYGLIAALIAVGMIAGATAIGEQVNAKFDQVADTVEGSGTFESTAAATGGAGGEGAATGGSE